MKTKKLFSSLVLAVLLLAMLTGTSEASVQSRSDVKFLDRTTASDFFKLIRQMETSNGSMGLNAIVDDTGTETSSSNNIDAHMIKNTEWGTVAMLVYSNYGTIPTSESATTTGNCYGIVGMYDKYGEYVAGIYDKNNGCNTNIYNAADKYKNVYTAQESITGDATLETKGWKGSCYFVTGSNPVFGRGTYGILGYSACYNNNGCPDCVGRANANYVSRAAVVCGSGI